MNGPYIQKTVITGVVISTEAVFRVRVCGGGAIVAVCMITAIRFKRVLPGVSRLELATLNINSHMVAWGQIQIYITTIGGAVLHGYH